uniref:Putative secreted protein of aegy sperm n=1 Tax=Aedes albopictus TaxID=7160 RepID=A0A023EXC3_AEDAL
METPNLEENFKLFYRIAKVLILELNNEDRVLAAQWLRKLAACQSPEDSERRNHFMTLLLITLQQKRIVGPFKNSPVDGNKLEPFQKEFQTADIQKLLDEELAQRPPPPLAQFGLTGGKISTEFAVTQEIPKFGVHFYYVYTLTPIYDFQRANQSRIPPPMQAPSQSTMRNLNAGVENLLRTEKKKLKVTVDQLGRKQIQIRDEHFAEFSGSGRPRRVPKRLQQRLGIRAPEPEPEPEIQLTSFVQEPSPPRRTTPQPATSTTVEQAVAAAVGAAVAAAASTTPPRTGGIPRPTGAIPKQPRLSGGVPRYTGAIPKATRVQQPPPQPSPQHPPAIEVQPPSPKTPVRMPARGPAVDPNMDMVPMPDYMPDPFATPTPPLFAKRGRTQGLTYKPEDFELDPQTKFDYPRQRIAKSKWTPSKRGERVMIRDIIKQHPPSEQTLQLSPDVREIAPLSEIDAQCTEIARRRKLVFQTDDDRMRNVFQKFYASRPVSPKALQFTIEEEASTIQPFLLDTTPVGEQRIQSPASLPRIVTPRSVTPRMPTPRPATPGSQSSRPTSPRSPTPRRTTPREASPRPLTPRDATPRAAPPARAPRQISDWFVEDEGLLDEEDIQLRDELIYIPSPIRAQTPRAYSPSPRQVDEGLLEDEEIEFVDDMPSPSQYRSPVRPPVHSPIQYTTPYYSPEVSPGGTTGRLIDAGDEVPAISPKSPHSIGSMMDDIMLTTPERMERLGTIMSQIGQQVEAHRELIQNIEELPTSPSLENLRVECGRGASALSAMHSRLRAVRESAQAQQPPATGVGELEVVPEEPEPFSPLRLSLQFQDLADVINTTMEGAQIIQQVAESVPEPVVQDAAERSLDTVDALQQISDRVHDVADAWEKRITDLDTSSLGLIDDDVMDESLFSSPARETANRMVEALDQSVREVIEEGGDPRSPAARNLQGTLRDFREALQNLSLESPSFLDESFPEALLDDTIDDLEASIQTQAAAISAVSKTPEKAAILDRAEEIVESMNDVLDEVQTIVTPEAGEQDDDDKFVAEFFAESSPQQELPPASEAMQQEMLNLLEKTRQQQQALLESSLEIEENAVDAAAVAASQQATQRIQQAQQAVTDMIDTVARSPVVYDGSFAWLGPMSIEPEERPTAAGRRQVRSRAAPRPPAGRMPAARSAASRPAAPRPAASRTAVARPSATRPPAARPPAARPPAARPAATRPSATRVQTRPQAIRRPPQARGASPEPLALPAGVQAPRPRAGSATPIPVRRPPRPIPLPGAASVTEITTQSSSSTIRTMIPRPGSATSER